nr:hypothetical protein REQ54_01066 [Rhizobium sp. Q54]
MTASMTAREKLTADLASMNVVLPLRYDDSNGTVFDAAGKPVCTIDVNRERPDVEVHKIGMWIILAVNTCGGFRLGGAQ